MSTRKFSLCVTACVVALSLGGCAADRLEHPSYWWDAKVLSIGPASSLTSDIDRECIPATPDGAASEVIVVRYRVGKSVSMKAYMDTRGERWVVGEKAYVHPDTCRIKHAFS